MRILVDKMPENREDCILYAGKKVYIDGFNVNMQKVTYYTHYCNDGKECDLNCGKCSRLKALS